MQRPEPRPAETSDADARFAAEGARGRTLCAGCGAWTRVSEQARLPGVPFCDECWSFARPLGDDDELGAGD